MYQEDIDKIKKKCICLNCISEKHVKSVIGLTGKKRKCSYCNKKELTIGLGAFAEWIGDVFDNFLYKTSEELDYLQNREGDPILYVIQEVADIDIEAAGDVRQILEVDRYSHEFAEMGEEQEFDENSHYDYLEIDGKEWNDEWLKKFVFPLKNVSRFFNKDVAEHLNNLFQDINRLVTKDKAKIIRRIGPKTDIKHLFRARLFFNDSNLFHALKCPDKELGPPPAKFASAGRMNARGISVFYGASSAEVAISEVRPIVGSNVAIANFEIIRPLQILDLTALDNVSIKGSYFDPDYKTKSSKVQFLSGLSHILSKPVMPGEEELDYLITQSIADFLAVEKGLDGILFPSVQTGKKEWNIALFHHASIVEELDEGNSIRRDAHRSFFGNPEEASPETEITIWEKTEKLIKVEMAGGDLIDRGSSTNQVTPTLRLEKESIFIAEIESVKYVTLKTPTIWMQDSEITDD
ncbi:RES family NAD+ phosphorylase [Chitinophaga sp. RCC_12]|uniref:RES family NAD+ phosphorylase n=1 Tax=Chitinophaga sp. RCC_12 TaxID=3239226 RepID=UPI003525795E